MGKGLSRCQDPQPSLGVLGLPNLPAPLQPLRLPLTPAPGAALELEAGLLFLQDLQVRQQRLIDPPVVPLPPQQAETERLSLQLLQHGPGLEGGWRKQKGGWGGQTGEGEMWGGHASPLCSPTCPL